MDSLQRVTEEAYAFGGEIAAMLKASTFPPEVKAAWASVVPYMDGDQLETFHGILTRNLEGQVAHEAEDVILLLKAAQMRRDFAVKHAEHNAEKELGELEKELEELEA